MVSVFEVFLFLRYSCRVAVTRFQLCPIALITWHRNASAPMGGRHECGRPLDCLISKSMMRLNYWLETAGLTSHKYQVISARLAKPVAPAPEVHVRQRDPERAETKHQHLRITSLFLPIKQLPSAMRRCLQVFGHTENRFDTASD